MNVVSFFFIITISWECKLFKNCELQQTRVERIASFTNTYSQVPNCKHLEVFLDRLRLRLEIIVWTFQKLRELPQIDVYSHSTIFQRPHRFLKEIVYVSLGPELWIERQHNCVVHVISIRAVKAGLVRSSGQTAGLMNTVFSFSCLKARWYNTYVGIAVCINVSKMLLS